MLLLCSVSLLASLFSRHYGNDFLISSVSAVNRFQDEAILPSRPCSHATMAENCEKS